MALRIYTLQHFLYVRHNSYIRTYLYMLQHILYIRVLTHTYNLHMNLQYYDLPIFWSSVLRNSIRIQGRISFLIRPSMALYDLYSLTGPGVTPT